jgi:hypothetical protein
MLHPDARKTSPATASLTTLMGGVASTQAAHRTVIGPEAGVETMEASWPAIRDRDERGRDDVEGPPGLSSPSLYPPNRSVNPSALTGA